MSPEPVRDPSDLDPRIPDPSVGRSGIRLTALCSDWFPVGNSPAAFRPFRILSEKPRSKLPSESMKATFSRKYLLHLFALSFTQVFFKKFLTLQESFSLC